MRKKEESTMFSGSISNRKLHCCLLALILLILIFLSIPLLLIYLANTHYQESRLAPTLAGRGSAAGGSRGWSGNSSLQEVWQQQQQPQSSQSSQATDDAINCTQFAIKHNLSRAEENVHCPERFFPCQSLCPDICIEQRRICDGVFDCPDRSDEEECYDSNGAIGNIFKDIVRQKNKSPTNESLKAPAKLENCTMEQKIICPCILNDPHWVFCENTGLTEVPNSLLPSVVKIIMSNNSISDIEFVQWPSSLSKLSLSYNQISRLGQSALQLAPKLVRIYLGHNQISYIHSKAFSGLSKLSVLNLESNRLSTFETSMLDETPRIAQLQLSDNMIDLPEQTSFARCKQLKELFLDHNRISRVRSHWFSNMPSLMWLTLANNEISFIEEFSFSWNYELEELNLSFNKIKHINRQMFASKLNIQRLHLSGNALQAGLPANAFTEIVHLKSLNLSHIEFVHLDKETFSYLKLDFIYFEKFRYCHYAAHVRVCRPLTDGLSSAEELLAFPVLKYAVWIVASVCSLGNVFVLLWRSISAHEDRTLSLFVKNLSIADLMMGIYLGAIGWQDQKFEHKFGQYAIEWMSSWSCTGIGFLAILSSELSVFILTIITIERYRSIMSISKFEPSASRQRAKLQVGLAWLVSLLIAGYPLAECLVRNSHYFATNGLCLPLHIDQPFTYGWQYSAFVYLGINFGAVMVIIVLYVRMYLAIMTDRQRCRPALFKAEKREDAILAVRFFFIVVTDCLCWIPIVVIKVIALANVVISSSIYGWLVVFIIPINSALNPIVYTLAAPTSLRAAVCRLLERLCYKIDRLTAASRYSSQSESANSSGQPDAHEFIRRRLHQHAAQGGPNAHSQGTWAAPGTLRRAAPGSSQPDAPMRLLPASRNTSSGAESGAPLLASASPEA